MNSYILFSNVGPKFLNELESVISQIQPKWWQKVEIPPHLTIGLGKAKDSEPKASREARCEGMQKEVQALLDTIKTKIFLLPSDLVITENGYIILKFQPVALGDSQDVSQLQTLHEGFVTIGRKQRHGLPPLFFNQSHISQHFAPHISVGKIHLDKPLVSEDIKKITEELLPKATKEKFLQAFNKMRILNIYQFEFCYGSGDPRLSKDHPLGPKNTPLATKVVPPRDFGVKLVKPFKADHDPDCFLLHFDTKEQAADCAQFLYSFNITSHLDSRFAKTVRPQDHGFGLVLNRAEYLTIAGMINKCYPGIAEKESGFVPKKAKPITHRYDEHKGEHKGEHERKKISEAAEASSRHSGKPKFSPSDPDLTYVAPLDEFADWAFEHNAQVRIRRAALGLD